MWYNYIKWDWRLWILSTCITSYLMFTVLCSITIGCCQSHPVMGEWYSSNQVRVLHFTVRSAVAFLRCGGLVHYLWNFWRFCCSVYQNWFFFDIHLDTDYSRNSRVAFFETIYLTTCRILLYDINFCHMYHQVHDIV